MKDALINTARSKFPSATDLIELKANGGADKNTDKGQSFVASSKLVPVAGVTVRFETGEVLRHKVGQTEETVGSVQSLRADTLDSKQTSP